MRLRELTGSRFEAESGGVEGGREGGMEGWRVRMEGEDGGRDGGIEGGMEGWKDGGWEWRDGGMEGWGVGVEGGDAQWSPGWKAACQADWGPAVTWQGGLHVTVLTA